MVTIQLQSNKAWGSFNVTLLSDTHTLKIQYEYSHSSVGVAKEGNIKRAPGLIWPIWSNWTVILPSIGLSDQFWLAWNNAHF